MKNCSAILHKSPWTLTLTNDRGKYIIIEKAKETKYAALIKHKVFRMYDNHPKYWLAVLLT